jgi:hypothetical protein
MYREPSFPSIRNWVDIYIYLIYIYIYIYIYVQLYVFATVAPDDLIREGAGWIIA